MKRARICILALAALSVLFPACVLPDTFLYIPDKSVVGRIETHTTGEDESLIEVARNFSLGFNAIEQANPQLDPFIPGSGVGVTVPMQWVLPDLRTGEIVVNLSELRLYYRYNERAQSFVVTFPIGIGDEGTRTPLGRFTIIQKLVRPSWVPPASVRAEDPTLPRVVPPGPENPLGSHALRLSLPSILIHGTHRPFGVGRKVSHGCIRLYPEDIAMLYRIVGNGTRVWILRQPIKVGTIGKRVYLEVHEDNDFKRDYRKEAVAILKKKRLYGLASMEKVAATIETKNGIPFDITKDDN